MANKSNEGNDSTGFLVNNGTTVYKNKGGFVGKLVITNVGTAATVIIYDNATTGSGNILWSYATADGKIILDLKVRAVNGITIVVNSGGAIAGYITYS